MTYNLANEFQRKAFLARCEDCAVVELTAKTFRSRNQNSYLHLLIGVVAIDTGNTLAFTKEQYFKRLVNPDLFIQEVTDLYCGKVQVIRSTADLTKEEMSMAIDRFKKWGAENGIYLPKRLTEHLLAEIRARINQDTCTFGFYQCRTTQPLVVRVCTPTSPAGATNSGHAYRCSRSQKSQLHMLNDIHLRLDFNAKTIVDIHPDLFTKMHNLVTRSTTLVNQNQSLTVVHTGASECLSFPTTLVNHPSGRNLLVFLVDGVMRHVGIQSSEPFIFLTGHHGIHEETTCISFELGIRQLGIADIDNNLT